MNGVVRLKVLAFRGNTDDAAQSKEREAQVENQSEEKEAAMTKADIASLLTELGALVEKHQARVNDYVILRALITVAAAVAAQDDEKPYTRTQRCLEEARDALAQEEGERA